MLILWKVINRLPRRRRARRLPMLRVERPQRPGWSVAMGSKLSSLRDDPALRSLSPAELHDWLVAHGGVDYGTTVTRLFVKGSASGTTVIRDARTRVLRRREPLRGTLVTSPSAGADVARGLLFNLDEKLSQAQEGHLDPRTVGTERYFETHHVHLKRHQVFQIRVEASISEGYAEWELELEVEVAGRRRRLTVRDSSGAPFRTSHCEQDRFDDRWSCGVLAGPGVAFRPAKAIPG